MVRAWIVHFHPAFVDIVASQLILGAALADGYTVHVTAKHLVNGHEMGPFRHYCKVVTNDPFIVCQIYDSGDPNGTMPQVEFIVAKKLTRPAVALKGVEHELARSRGRDRDWQREGTRCG